MQQIKNVYHLVCAIIANCYYRFPSRKLICIGITGTDGKTTTASLVYHILKTSGQKAALITTVGAYINNKVYDVGFHVTTPSPFSLQKYIKMAADSGSKYLILEVTSHALNQNRVWGIHFRASALTNVTHEHLDYHKTYENYLRTKIRLLQMSVYAVVNMDDFSYPKILLLLTRPFSSYSLTNQKADFTPKKFPFQTKLLGDFNKQNCLAAIAICKQLGIADASIRKAISTFDAPNGRQAVVYDKEFKVIIDFAHTPNAFEKILPAVKPKKGKLIHVFGSAGLRDASKRPLMGKVSNTYSDIIFLTSEDPRTESVEVINKQIAEGITKKYLSIPDRKKAIAKAISLAKKGDTVIITGKSHEKSMNYGNGEIPWDEFETVNQALTNK